MRVCSVEGCGRKHSAKGLCNSCYQKTPERRSRNREGDAKRRLKERGTRSATERRRITGWSAEDVERAWKEQGGRCAICPTLLKRGGSDNNSMNADHDHETGRRRALLCKVCNLLEGWLLASPLDSEQFGRAVEAYRAKYA